MPFLYALLNVGDLVVKSSNTEPKRDRQSQSHPQLVAKPQATFELTSARQLTNHFMTGDPPVALQSNTTLFVTHLAPQKTLSRLKLQLLRILSVKILL